MGVGSKDLATREGALGFLESTKSSVLGLHARAGVVRPHVILFADRDPNGEPCLDEDGRRMTGAYFYFPDTLAGGDERDAFSAVIRELLVLTHACGVMTVMESWVACGKLTPDAPTPERARARLPKDWSAPFAGRREGIVILLEHIALEHPVEQWAETERAASGKAYFKPFVDMASSLGIDGNRAQRKGRFVDLLRRSAS
jgi:hypothetical protein